LYNLQELPGRLPGVWLYALHSLVYQRASYKGSTTLLSQHECIVNGTYVNMLGERKEQTHHHLILIAIISCSPPRSNSRLIMLLDLLHFRPECYKEPTQGTNQVLDTAQIRLAQMCQSMPLF